MKVNIDDLLGFTSGFLLKLKEAKGNDIELQSDYYWDIDSDELYNPYNEPKNISLGQLSDDLKEIMRLKNRDDGIFYDLQRISNIIKALSIENSTAF